ncbi:MAG TPA: hypothetical protein DIC34_15325 [Treponema sp.]|nr:MAG: hypothetical protein A2001_18105 [Treponema sp. GWC1_61_84]OHE70154.1 MAG: hypothetical protein A2413_02655 [Treponema sp. RIFOXYC1_FULL_61_9]HCM27887.1 hypothetical protein [Treponema sp.]
MNWNQYVLLVIDVQNDFTNDIENPIEKMDYEKRLTRLMTDCRNRNIEIIYIRGKYKKDKSDWLNFLQYNNHPVLVEGTTGFEHEKYVNELNNEKVIYKQTLDAFINTELNSYLKSKDKKFLFITGFSTSVCVHLTMMHGIQLGYWTCMVKDCCWDEETHQNNIISMYKNMIINIKNHDELFKEENYQIWNKMIEGNAVRPGLKMNE